ncbi:MULTISPECIES: AI-2E family transporter [Streptomyces]|uniref:AI-2E family transporter n=1 Tax=Streptomyces TaxID=1883 RepID=UPI00099B4190|nr:AI-2E family transporter [Streptomyces durhamensis]
MTRIYAARARRRGRAANGAVRGTRAAARESGVGGQGRRGLGTIRPRPVERSGSWLRAGFALGLGGTLAWLLVHTVLQIGQLLSLFLAAVFIAIGLEPLVALLSRHRVRRGWAVLVVLLASLLCLSGFVALIAQPVTDEINSLVKAIPKWLTQLHDRHTALGHLEDRYHLISKVRKALASGGSSVLGGLLGAGRMVLSLVTSAVIVVVVTIYLMVALPEIKQFGFRFVAASRRARVETVTDEILTRTGRFMLANLATSGIAGLATFAWCAAIGVPYPAALGFFVALMDLIPVVGSTVAGVAVSLVALSVSLPVAGATAGFYVGFRLAEDYLIMPRAMKYAVDVHPVVTVVGVLVGGALLGIIGALVAVPAAVAIGILLDEYVFPRTDAS